VLSFFSQAKLILLRVLDNMICRGEVIEYYRGANEVSQHLIEAVLQSSWDHDYSLGLAVFEHSKSLDSSCLRDAARFLGAALLQFLAHNYLSVGGYETWAQVTRYYSRYFSIMALSRLVGYGTFRLKSKGTGGLKQFWVVRSIEEEHSYLIGYDRDIRRAVKKVPEISKYQLPSGSGSHKTAWLLFSEICRSWDESELEEAAFPAPSEADSYVDLWSSYEDRMLLELNERSLWNYLNVPVGYFFGELDGLTRWKRDSLGWSHHHDNPLSAAAPMEDTYEEKSAWSTIEYLVSILVSTPARSWIEWYSDLVELAPANVDFRSFVVSRIHTLLSGS